MKINVKKCGLVKINLKTNIQSESEKNLDFHGIKYL